MKLMVMKDTYKHNYERLYFNPFLLMLIHIHIFLPCAIKCCPCSVFAKFNIFSDSFKIIETLTLFGVANC